MFLIIGDVVMQQARFFPLHLRKIYLFWTHTVLFWSLRYPLLGAGIRGFYDIKEDDEKQHQRELEGKDRKDADKAIDDVIGDKDNDEDEIVE